MSFEQLVEEIQKLSADEQIQLRDLLDEQCCGIDPEIEKAHLEIIEQRMKNPGKLIPAEEVFRHTRKLLNELQASRRGSS